MTCEIWRPSQDSHEMKTEIWCEIFGRANVELLERDKVREREGTRRGRRISSPPRVHRPLRIPIGHVRHSRRGQSMWRKNGKGLIAYKREKETHTERSKANTWKWDRSDSDLVTLNQWLTRPRTCVMLHVTEKLQNIVWLKFSITVDFQLCGGKLQPVNLGTWGKPFIGTL